MNKKGFTLIEILAAVTILGILSVLAVAWYTNYLDYSKQKSYDAMAKSVATAAEEYLMDNPTVAKETIAKDTPNGKKYILKNSTEEGIDIKDLIKQGYLNSAIDPDNKGKECTGKVTIGLIKGETKGALDQYMYVVDECCTNHKARYTYTIEVDRDTKKTKSIVEEDLNNSDACPEPAREVEYCIAMYGNGFNRALYRDKYLNTEHKTAGQLANRHGASVSYFVFKDASNPVYNCFVNYESAYYNCIPKGTLGTHYRRATSSEVALPATQGCYYVTGRPCLSGDTEVEVYDKKKKKRYKKKLKDLTPDDLVLAWDFEKGEYVWIEPLWIKQIEIVDSYYLVKFSDGSFLEVVGDHRIFNCEENKFTRVICETPIGTHTINSKGEIVELVSIEEIKEQNTCCNVITKEHINIFANGILTSWAFNNLYPIKDMKYQKQDNNTFTEEELKDIPTDLIKGLRLDEIPVELMGSKQETLDSIKANVDRIIKLEQRF